MSPTPLPSALHGLMQGPGVHVRQKRELLQALTGWSVANRYVVTTKDGAPVFEALERGGLWNLLSRRFNPFYENVTEWVAAGGQQVMKLVMPWALWFRHADVVAPDGTKLGRVQRRFTFLRTRVDVMGSGGEVELQVRGPFFKFFFFTDFVFSVSHQGRPVARIAKHWGGFITEALTNADSFTVEFEPGFTDARLRVLTVAATFLLDLVRFEEADKSLPAQAEGTSTEPTFDD